MRSRFTELALLKSQPICRRQVRWVRAVSALITLIHTYTSKENLMNYYQPCVVAKMTLDEARAIEPEVQPTWLGILQAHGHEHFQAPIVAQMRQTDFPVLFPDAPLHEGPVVVVCLPDRMKYDLEELATSPLFPVNVESRDLMKSTTCLVAVGRDNELHLDAERMIFTINSIGEQGLYLLFICDGHLWIVNHPLDSHWGENVANTMMTAGINYRPYQSYTDAELAAAACKSLEKSTENETVSVWRPEVVYKSRTLSGT